MTSRLTARTTAERPALRAGAAVGRACRVCCPFLLPLLLLVALPRAEPAHAARPDRRELTAYPDFAHACIATLTGYAPRPHGRAGLRPVWGHKRGDCAVAGRLPLIFSATQENARNTHYGAVNNLPGVHAYPGDFDYGADFGRWLNVQRLNRASTPVVALTLDTVNFRKINVTGWPLRYGHLFIGLSDRAVTASLAKPVHIEFDIRVRASKVRPDLHPGYNGRRIMVGAVANWKEALPRTNTAHFIEFDLVQSPGYTRSYGEPKYPLCGDARYDRCFYNPAGKYPEGREIRYSSPLHAATMLANRDRWVHVRIPLTQAIKKLRWVSPPAAWSSATLNGVYIGIESQGATRTRIELKNYHVWTGEPDRGGPSGQ